MGISGFATVAGFATASWLDASFSLPIPAGAGFEAGFALIMRCTARCAAWLPAVR
jgi:hypothetical protein